ncbi:cytochrome P450 [Mycobacterium tuberculosis]|nr:cytochrome P450 [Mycobacterium tuberculosis]
MLTSQARVRTDRGRRYLKQLCEHGDRLSAVILKHGDNDGRTGWNQGGVLPAAQHIDRSGAEGVIDFGWGRCTLRADGENLTLRVEAENQRSLQRLQDVLAGRLQLIGRRDALTVTWDPIRPGTEAAAIIGALSTPEGRADPFPLYARAHEMATLSTITDGWSLVCSYAAVDQVLRDPRFGPAERPRADRDPGGLPSMARSILWANPPDHGRMRSLISQVFTARRVAALRPAIEDAVDTLLAGLAGSGPADFMDRFAFPLPVTVICELLGVPEADRRRFRPLAADLTEALELGAFTIPPGAPDPDGPIGAAARELAGYFTRLIRARRTDPRDDLVSALVAARDAGDGRLSDQELLANLILLLVAGFETTTNLLGNGLAALFDHPGVLAGLRSGEIAVSGFVEEVLRYDSPVQATTRTARADDLTIDGVDVPRGANVILLIGAANRDPVRYVDPGRFDPTRPDIKPLSFGAGPHICLGNSLARLEAAIAFPRLLARFPAISPIPEMPPIRRDRLVLRGHETLPVRLLP